MEKLIYAKPEAKKALQEHFKVSQTSVSLALRFKRDSEMARRIREYAVNKLDAYPVNI